jgi:hypothetical protein
LRFVDDHDIQKRFLHVFRLPYWHVEVRREDLRRYSVPEGVRG